MKIWFDTEFLDHDESIELVSLGAVREDGKTFYAENNDCDLSRANKWVQKNVIPHLMGPTMSYRNLATEFEAFCGVNPEFWAYYCAWDWWLVCRLMGGFMKLPQSWMGYCNDINTIGVVRSIKTWRRPPQHGTEHHALADAVWTRDAYFALMEAHNGKHQEDGTFFR